MANFQAYNITLSDSEVNYPYSEGMGAPPFNLRGLVVWLPLNGNANDYSGGNGVIKPYFGNTQFEYTSQWA